MVSNEFLAEITEQMKADEELVELQNYDGDDKVISSYEMQTLLKNQPSIARYRSEIDGLDNIVGGFGEGQLIAMSGWTKCGKTTFCQTLTYNFALQLIGCLWFTYELPVYEFFEKFNKNVPAFYLPQRLIPYNLKWVEKKIIESILKYKSKIIFIDHLHYLFPLTNNQNLSVLVGHTIRQLKIMAIKHRIVIFILCHTVKVESGDKPKLNDIRDSSFIAQESDIVMMMSRKDFDEDDLDSNSDTSARLRILANRHNGRRGLVNLDFKDGFYREIFK